MNIWESPFASLHACSPLWAAGKWSGSLEWLWWGTGVPHQHISMNPFSPHTFSLLQVANPTQTLLRDALASAHSSTGGIKPSPLPALFTRWVQSKMPRVLYILVCPPAMSTRSFPVLPPALHNPRTSKNLGADPLCLHMLSAPQLQSLLPVRFVHLWLGWPVGELPMMVGVGGTRGEGVAKIGLVGVQTFPLLEAGSSVSSCWSREGQKHFL